VDIYFVPQVWEDIKSANNYHWYLDCYLDQMKKAEEEYGTRLLDVLDIHYYSESAREGAEDRVQSVRTLYEKGFRENSQFGDTLVSTKTEDVSKLSSYAAINGDDTGLVTAMITNKSMSEKENAIINLDNSDKQYKSAAVYGDSSEIRLIDKVENISDNKVEVELPAFSAAMVVINENADEFSDNEIYDENK